MKKRILLCACALTLALLTGCGGAKETNETTFTDAATLDAPTEQAAEPAVTEESATEPAEGMRHAEITVENYGTIKLELDANTAPITVENFVKLAQDGFYDGLTFHRIMDGFMIQGGDPLGNGTGGSSEHIKGEFAANGVENNIAHTKGTISMARATPYDSASSQFFIMVDDAPYLDGMYAAFGRVTEGIEIVEQIAKDAKPVDNNGSIPREEQPVMTSVIITD
ncbi:MAG: peptidylprolyl isomerase [Oscillospiraceae bacterium]|nr:peptidylprolyl isomerase [Oscillospiraceae bacterium]